MISAPPMKRLQLHDSRIVNRFKKHVLSHLQENGTIEKAEALFLRATFPPSIEVIDQMEQLDDQMGRAIAHEKKNLRDARYCVNTKLLCKYMIIVGRE